MTPHLLLFLAGANIFLALLHFWTGLRAPGQKRHLVAGFVALTLTAYVALSGVLYETESVASYRRFSVAQGATGIVFVALVWWFVSEYTSVRPTGVLWSANAVLAGALILNFMSPAGIFYRGITGLSRATDAWGGPVTVPVATANPWQWVFNVAFLGLLVFTAYAVVVQYRRGKRRAATLLGVAVATIATPSLADTYLLGTSIFTFPYTEVGLTLFTLVLSAGIFDGLVQLVNTQEALVESERRARSLVDGAPDGIAIVDLASDGAIVELNPAGRSLLGVEEGLLPGSLHEVLAEARPDGSPSPEGIGHLVDEASRGPSKALELTFRRRDGSEFQGEVRLTPLTGGGNSRLVRVSFLDITERKAARRREDELTHQLHQVQKLETLGTLAGGIAHDFNNLLTPIIGNLEVVREDLGEGVPQQENIEAALDAAERAKELVRQIMLFGRRPSHREGVANVAAVMKRALRLVGSGYPSAVSVRVDTEAEDGFVALSETSVQQVVVNLATNAFQAMPEGGLLTATVRRREEEDGTSSVVLSIADTGTGMPAEMLDRIFEPFFTTREPGAGNGLGLSVVHGIVSGAGGHVEVKSSLGKGTLFHVVLPEHVPDGAGASAGGEPTSTGHTAAPAPGRLD